MTVQALTKPLPKLERQSVLYLWYICIVAAFGGLLFGYDAVVVSGTNSQVLKQFQFSATELGFYVSCVLWGCAAGSACSGPAADKWGRRMVLILSSITIFISAMWSGFADSATSLIFARLLGGFGIGLATMVCPLYISEVSPEQYRGRMVTLFQLTITIGIVMCVFANWGIFSFAENNAHNTLLSDFAQWMFVTDNWRAMFLTEAIPGILFLLLVFFIPESPRFLVKQGKHEQALAVLSKLNSSEKAQLVLEDIKKVVNEESQMRFSDLFSRRFKPALVIALLICIFSEASGCSIVFYYGPIIFEAAGFSMGGSLGGFAVIAIVNMIATLFALQYVDSSGRKKLLKVGAIGCLVSHLVIGTLFYAGVTGWPIVIAINAFIAFFACALGPVKYVFISEIFPNQVRGQAVAFATMSIWLTSAVVAQIFPMLQEIMNTGGIFYLLAAEVLCLLLIVHYMMPETKGRTIEEIEQSWGN